MPQLTRKILVHHSEGQFKIFISKLANELFVGGVIYYTKEGSWSTGSQVNINFDYQQFVGHNEKDIYDQSVNWIEQNLGNRYQLEELPIG